MSLDVTAPESLADLAANLRLEPQLSAVPPAEIQAQLQGLRALRQTVILWLIALGLAGFTLTLILVTTTLQDDVAQIEAELQSIQQALTRLETPSTEVLALTATLTKTLTLAAELEAVRPPVGVDWPVVMSQVGNYNSTQLVLTDLIQENNRVTLNGEAVDSTVVTRYRGMLETSDRFTRVVIQSIKVLPPATSAPTPVAPAVPATTAMTVAFVIIMELSL